MFEPILKYNTLNSIESIYDSKDFQEEFEKSTSEYANFIENVFFRKIYSDEIISELKHKCESLNIPYNKIEKINEDPIFSLKFITNIISYYKKIGKSENNYDDNTGYFTVDTLFYYIDLINIKVLYVESNSEKYYLSSINNRKLRNLLLKTKINDNLELVLHEDIQKIFVNVIESFEHKDKNIDCNKYDIIMIMSHFKYLNFEHEITLENFDIQNNFDSCIMNSINEINNVIHVISVSKCHENYVFHTTWKNYNNNRVIDFIPLKEKTYIIRNKEFLLEYHEGNDRGKKYKYNTRLDDNIYISNIFNNIYFFVTKENNKNYKLISGGGYITNEKCLNIYREINNSNLCWLSSIINSLCYADKTAYIVYKKSSRFIEKICKYIKYYFDNEFYKRIHALDLVLSHDYYHILSLYIHSSYYLLKSGKLEENELKYFTKKIKIIYENLSSIIMYSCCISESIY